MTSVLFIFNHHQGLYHKISSSLGCTRFLFKVLQSFWNLRGGPLPVLPNHLSTFKTIGVFYQTHTVVKLRKTRQKFISRKTDHSVCRYGLPVPFMGRIWRPGDRLWTALNYYTALIIHMSYTSLKWRCYHVLVATSAHLRSDLGSVNLTKESVAVLTKCSEAVLVAKSAPFTGDAPCGRFDQKECGRFDQMKCGRFSSYPSYVAVLTKAVWPFWPK